LRRRIKRRNRGRRDRSNLDGVVLDDGIGEQLLAHLLDRRPGASLVGLGEFDLDVLALADVGDAAEAEIAEGMGDRLALWIGTPVLRVIWIRAFISLSTTPIARSWVP
jgi:hypothetical protein